MIKKILTSTVLYALAGILPAAVGFFLLPLYLRILSPEDYGLITLVNSFAAILGVVMGLKLESAYRVYYYDQESHEAKSNYLNSIFTATTGISLLLGAIVLLFGNAIFRIAFGGEIDFYPYGMMATVNVFIASMTVLYAIDCQNREDRTAFLWYSIGGALITVVLQFLGIVIWRHGIISFLYATMVSALLQLGYVIFTGKLKIVRLDIDLARTALKYSLPLIPFLFLLVGEQQMDRYFLKKYFTLETVGIYALLIMIGGIFTLGINSLDNAVRPGLFNSLNENKDMHTSTKYQQMYVGISLLMVAAITILSYILPHWIDNQKYLVLIDSIPLFAMSLIPLIYVRYFAVLFSYKKDSVNLALISFAKLMVLIIVYYQLVPNYGISGVLLSIFIANTINAAIFFLLIKYKHKMGAATTKDMLFSLSLCVGLFFYWSQSPF